jgi:hypothetical protein
MELITNPELKKKWARLDSILFEAKQLEKDICVLMREEVDKKRAKKDLDLCGCGHDRSRHGKSLSVNYTDGACQDCKCRNFIMK